MVKRGFFPAPRKLVYGLGAKGALGRVAFVESEVEEWIRSRQPTTTADVSEREYRSTT